MNEISECIVSHLPDALSKVLGIEKDLVNVLITSGKVKVAPTPDSKLGDYGIAIHAVLRNVERSKWDEVGRAIASELYSVTHDKCWVEKVDFVNGYVNVTIDYSNILTQLVRDFATGKVFEELKSVGMGSHVIVEHTSANPVHPLHIGSGRNSVLGDTYARLLRKLGFNVQTRFYVNDMGRQVAVLVYGVSVAESKGVVRPESLKVDHWYGVIYALTHVLVELCRLRSELKGKMNLLVEKAESACRDFANNEFSGGASRDLGFMLCEIAWKKNFKLELLEYTKRLYEVLKRQYARDNTVPTEILKLIDEIRSLAREYREYLAAERRLATHYPELYNALKSSVLDYKEVEESIRKLMVLAEGGKEDVLALFRRVSESVISGFKETLKKLDIEFNGFDYESSNEILEKARNVVKDLAKTSYARVVEGGAIEVDLNKAAEDHEYVKGLFYPDQAGRFVVQRSDGTTLYVTRDIAYTLYKFRDLGAERVYNVIAVEQAREQKQLKAVLHILGYVKEAENLHHFAYEMVHLKGARMSGRRGTYYTVDEMLVDSKLNVLQKLVEKESSLNAEELMSVAEKLAVANTRTLLLSVDPGKVLVFDPKKLGEVEYGTIIEYAFVRAQGVVRNLWGLEFLNEPGAIYAKMADAVKGGGKMQFSPEEKKLIEILIKFKDVLLESYREMKPNKLLEYAIGLALEFNKFYEKYPVIGERDAFKRSARIALTLMVLVVLSELMDIMGIPKLKRM
ncbi:MAG: arginine--tRNA ligase [Desulfurococcaceae archaeon]